MLINKINARVQICSFLCFLFFFSSAFSETKCISIQTLPTQITKPGNYCLENNIYNGDQQNAITILSSGVVLDLKGFTISSNTADPATKLFGIYSKDVRDITIKNGIIRGFMYGIYLSDSNTSSTGPDSLSGGYKIEGVTLKENYFRGIRLEGSNHLVRNNVIRSTGGSLVFSNSFAIGIEIIGPGAKIEKNIISDTHSMGNGESVALSFSNNCSGSEANDNRIINHEAINSFSSTGHSFGIWVGGNPKNRTNVHIRDNNIDNMYFGFAFSSPTTGWYGNNLIRRATCNYTIGSSTVSTFDHTGVSSCPNVSDFDLNKMNELLLTQ